MKYIYLNSRANIILNEKALSSSGSDSDVSQNSDKGVSQVSAMPAAM